MVQHLQAAATAAGATARSHAARICSTGSSAAEFWLCCAVSLLLLLKLPLLVVLRVRSQASSGEKGLQDSRLTL
jgi:nitrogen fixation/metabolism regulation signal transduction histidine kinase